MAHTQGRLTAYVLLLKPEGFAEDWEKTDLWQSAKSIPGVELVIDDDGIEARRFHALTSGQALLYGRDGRLLFSGGITGSRGHAGDNAGRSAIASLVNRGEAERDETFVFGCPLFDESECRESKDERTEH
jgi:glyoxylase-like metal-dependent hydrolase (beta-lactamase superfamily II)